MKPQDKMRWFWATGVLPGTLFDDFNDNHGHVIGRGRKNRFQLRLRHGGRQNR